jgi:hypothetical protein
MVERWLIGAICGASLIAALVAATTLTALAAPRSLSLTVVVADGGDARLPAVDEAVAFWNQELAAGAVELRLGPVVRLVQPVPDSALGQLSEAVLGGRFDAAMPPELQGVPGDIIVALSVGEFISFARSWHPGGKGLAAIKRPDTMPMSLPNVPRNVIAHELGHVLGLGHNSDPTTLMCGRPAPCRPGLFTSDTPRFFPLTATDKTNLQARWNNMVGK